MLPTVVVMAALPSVSTSDPNKSDKAGIMISQTRNEPAQMINEYLSPMM